MTLNGKKAIVTGAARGIGRELACRLAADGATVVAVDLLDTTETLQLLAGDGHCGMTCDVSSPDEVDRLHRRFEESYGRCDILVNNAGIYPPMKFDEISFEDWRRVQSINVDSVFLMSLVFSRGMRAAKWGRIVNMGSGITFSGMPGLLPYVASKGAVHALTRALANELGGQGITVNAIAPSVIPTAGVYERAAGAGGMSTEQELDAVVSRQTVKRRSKESDLSGALAFLVSDAAEFVTAQIIHVDGGLTRSGA